LTFLKLGGVVISGGRRRSATLRADCTSRAAASMSRSRSNWRVIDAVSWLDVEVIAEMPGMVENCRSSGSATEEAIDSGLAPGSVAFTWMVGKSMRGKAAIGRSR
jgi:hypothetical protein